MTVEVKTGSAIGLTGIEVLPGEHHVCPAFPQEWGIYNAHQRLFSERHIFPFLIVRIPNFEIGVSAKAKFTRAFILGKLCKEGGVVPFLGGDLDRITVPWFKILVRRYPQPKGHSSAPVI